MARIVVLAQYFPPETNAGANRLGPLADALATEHDVVVSTLKPSFPSADAFASTEVARADAQRGYPVRRAFAFRPHSRSLAVRAVRELGMSVALAASSLRGPVDVIVASAPSMFLAPVGLAVARLRRALFVLDIRDLTWQLAGELDVGGQATAVLAGAMWWTVSRADLIVSATPGITKLLVARGLEERTITIPNLLSADLRTALEGQGEPTPKARPVVAYTGLLGQSQGLRVLLDAAERLPHADFVLAGDGSDRELLERDAARRRLENVLFTGWLDRDGVLDVYRRADVLFLQTRDTAYTNATVLPVKMFEYMASGTPFVYAGKGIAVELLQEAGCALVVDPDDGDAIVAALAELLADDELRSSLGRRGREWARSAGDRESVSRLLPEALRERGLA